MGNFSLQIIFLTSLAFAWYIIYIFRRSIRHQKLAAKHGCKPIRLIRYKLPFGLDRKYEFLTTKGNEIDKLLVKRFSNLGSWSYVVNDWGIAPIATVDPAMVKAILATNFKDWDVGEHRHEIMGPWLGRGVFVSDGALWSHARSILRPSFAKDDIYDLRVAERHFQSLLHVLPSGADGWTVCKDIYPLIRRFALDLVTEYFCDGSIDTQQHLYESTSDYHSKRAKTMEYAFDKANKGVVSRLRAGPFFRLVNPSSWRIACTTFTKFANEVLDTAISSHEKTIRENSHAEQDLEMSPSFVNRLTMSTNDRKLMRDVVVQMLFAGIDSSTSMIAFAILNLARTPGAWQRLRDEVYATFGEDDSAPLTVAGLKSCRYLQNVIKETLRLYPPIPMNTRTAVKDTVLPVGGGDDGQSPAFAPKGTEVRYSCYVMQRREDIWGPDALDWKPDRWINRPHGWEYLPFNGGPRICLGQKWSLGKGTWILARLAQTFEQLHSLSPEPVDKPLDTTFELALFPLHGVQVRLCRNKLG